MLFRCLITVAFFFRPQSTALLTAVTITFIVVETMSEQFKILKTENQQH